MSTDPAPRPDAGPVAVTGAAVRLTFDVLLDPTLGQRMSVGVVWSCAACQTSIALGDIASALDALGRHAYGHHHRGPGALT